MNGAAKFDENDACYNDGKFIIYNYINKRRIKRDCLFLNISKNKNYAKSIYVRPPPPKKKFNINITRIITTRISYNMVRSSQELIMWLCMKNL